MSRTKYKKQKNGRYITRVWDGTYKDGEKHYAVLTTRKSSLELERIVAKFKSDVAKRGIVRESGMSVYEYAIAWLDTYKAERSNNTRQMYRRIIDKYFSELDEVNIRYVERYHVQGAINRASGKKRTQQQILLTFKQVLRSAVADKLLSAEDAGEIFRTVESVKYHATEKRALTDREKEAIFKADFRPADRAFVYLLYGCGIRRGEALALTASDFDLDKREVTVNKSHEFVNGIPKDKPPKTIRGYRTVPIPAPVFGAIREYVSGIPENQHLFTMQNGDPATRSSYNKMWIRILQGINAVTDEPVYGLTAHIFRHNYCSSLCYQIPKISIKKIAQLMGDTEAVVMEVYNHMILEKEDAAGAIDSAMGL